METDQHLLPSEGNRLRTPAPWLTVGESRSSPERSGNHHSRSSAAEAWEYRVRGRLVHQHSAQGTESEGILLARKSGRAHTLRTAPLWPICSRRADHSVQGQRLRSVTSESRKPTLLLSGKLWFGSAQWRQAGRPRARAVSDSRAILIPRQRSEGSQLLVRGRFAYLHRVLEPIPRQSVVKLEAEVNSRPNPGSQADGNHPWRAVPPLTADHVMPEALVE